MPPIARPGPGPTRATVVEPLEPDRLAGVGLRAGSVDGAAAEVVRARRDGPARLVRVVGGVSHEEARGTAARTAATGRSSGPRCTPSASAASATSSRSFTKSRAPNRRVRRAQRAGGRRAAPRRPRFLVPQLDRAGAPAARAASTTSTTSRGAASARSVMHDQAQVESTGPPASALPSARARRVERGPRQRAAPDRIPRAAGERFARLCSASVRVKTCEPSGRATKYRKSTRRARARPRAPPRPARRSVPGAGRAACTCCTGGPRPSRSPRRGAARRGPPSA